MKKIIGFSIIVVLLAVMCFVVYRYINNSQDSVFKLSGEVQITRVDVAFKVSGSIAHKYFSEGMFVKKNQLLAELDNETYLSQQKIAISNEDVAKWGLEELKTNLKKAGTTNKNLLEKAQAQLNVATANRELADYQLSYTKLYAPLDGVILATYKEESEIAQAGLPVFSIGNTDKLWIRAYLPETKANLIKLGQKMIVKVDSMPNEKFEGKVVFISDVAEFIPKQVYTTEERVKLVYKVKIEIVDTKGILKSGIPADVFLEE